MFEYFEPLVRLNLPRVDLSNVDLNWVRYNPRKDINRWGVSLVSMDGGDTGIPDLDSLAEINRLNGTSYGESDFRVPTPLFHSHFKFLEEHFDLGRSHIIRLGIGGFFPYHRDYDRKTLRVVFAISGCDDQNFVWIQNDKVLKLCNQCWYFINTKMIHSVFSFKGCEFAVFNILNNERANNSLVRQLWCK